MAFESVLRGRPHQLSVSEYIKRKLGFAALGFIDAEVRGDREISGRELQKRMQEKLDLNVSISLINRERRRMGWVHKLQRAARVVHYAVWEYNRPTGVTPCISLFPGAFPIAGNEKNRPGNANPIYKPLQKANTKLLSI